MFFRAAAKRAGKNFPAWLFINCLINWFVNLELLWDVTMPRQQTLKLTVEFGDCDPAQIAFYPNFFRWYDAAARHFFEKCGVPAWRDLEKSDGIIGTPVVEIHSNFMRPTTYGDEIEICTFIEEWHADRFVMSHRMSRGEKLLAQSSETRIFAIRHPEDSTRIKAVPIPSAIKKLCE
jgi:4-hydroxybenzoyl-CoA thioesterase